MVKRLAIFYILVFLWLTLNLFAGEERRPIPGGSDKETHEGNPVFENDVATQVVSYSFYSPLSESLIGTTPDKLIDTPSDNVFNVTLNTLPQSEDLVWLSYDLRGVQDHTAVSRSINDELSVGGHLVKLSHEWRRQKELISAKWLKAGINRIRFSLPETATYSYQVRNLKLTIVSNGKKTDRVIVVNQPSLNYYEDQGYIKGFIDGKDAEHAVLFVESKKETPISGAFEFLLQKPKISSKSWEVTLVAKFPDGELLSKKVQFNKAETADYQNPIADFKQLQVQQSITSKGAELQLEPARLTVLEGALDTPQKFSITALRDVDLVALGQGLVNVTETHDGYRFLPHGDHFKTPAQVALGYDRSKIPEGYTANDIRTFYFDETTTRWIPLTRDSIDVVNQKVISTTTHFTDMINGVIQIPESPQTQAYHPNSIKDIQAANPSAGIFTLSPPTANAMGNTSLFYPIEVPAGRPGMQPQLGISYNSEGGNGWLGVGWDLQTPSIGIETRWGVPRYDPDQETETYTLAGEQLSPITYRSAPIDRTQNKQFYPRIEGSFDKIIRRGDHPSNYWWEVTDKNGTRYSYGGTEAGGVDPNTVLSDGDGNIGHWALKEVRDLNDNFVLYEYSKVRNVGVVGGRVMGIELYCQKITYTGHGSTLGKYTVTFMRDQELGESGRTDILINARLGFKQVTADRLRKIEVAYNGEAIRSYELTYTEGPFYKTLLSGITEFDDQGVAFNTHSFDYFDDVRPASSENYTPLGPLETWYPKNDNIHGDFIQHLFPPAPPSFNDKASALSGTKSGGFETGVASTFGLDDGILYAKTSTAGGNYSYSQNGSEGILALIDINGDNLPDKVFQKDGRLQFRANQSGPDGSVVFGERQPITGIQDFSKGTSRVNTVGIEVDGPLEAPLFTGSQFAFESNQTTVYFSDVNADGLMDIVNNGIVYFNRLVNGTPTFDLSSEGTPSPITSVSAIDPSIVEQDPLELQKEIDQNPLQDLVRIWIAPFEGQISITEPVQLIQDTTPERAAYTTADGVRVAIQHENTELWSARIEADDYAPKTPVDVNSIAVKSGDRIYFRVQSVYDGSYDQVQWNPIIAYSAEQAELTDANNLPIYQYHSADDFLLSAPTTTGMPFDGKVLIEGRFIKPVTSDTVHAEIVKTDSTGQHQEILWQQDFPWNVSVNEPIFIKETVSTGDRFYFNVSADTNVNWSELSWRPHLYYIASHDTAIPLVNDPSSNPTHAFYPSVDYQTFNQTLQRSLPWQYIGNSGSVTVHPNLSLNENNEENGTIFFSIKKSLVFLAKESVEVKAGQPVTFPALSVEVSDGDELYFEYFTTNSALAEAITVANVSVQSSTVEAGLSAVAEPSIFGAMYRYWGQFVYNGNPDRDTQPIIQSDLHLNTPIPDPLSLTKATTPQQMASLYRNQGGTYPYQDIFVPMSVQMQEQAWQGYDYLTYLKQVSVSSSRLGNKYPSASNPIVPGSPPATGASGIVKISETQTSSFSAGAGFGSSFSSGSTTYQYDFMDMNGDRYPDILSKNRIQYSLPTGGLSSSATPNTLGEVSQSNHSTLGFTLRGTFLSSSDQNSPSKSKGSKSSDAQTQAEISFGISVSYNNNTDHTAFAWMDINGDALPDRVYEDGNVALNLGYKFADKEPWGYGHVSQGQANSIGAGLGVNILNNSISFGTGLSRTDNETQKTLYDVNGDGLLDYIIPSPSPSSSFQVKINTGNGFASSTIQWTGAEAVSENSSTGESTNSTATGCIPYLLVKFCTNLVAAVSNGVNRETVSLADIDGDGYPDYLSSEQDDQLTVQRSTINRTNLLKQVNRPFGVAMKFDYQRMGNSYDLPFSKWVLTSVEMNDGFEGDGADRLYTTFAYQDGVYNRNERDFYGFQTVTTTQHDTENHDAPYRIITRTYINDNYYEKGLLVSEVLTDSSNNKYTETENTYQAKNLKGKPISDNGLENYYGTAFPALHKVYQHFYEGHPIAQKSTHFDYEYDLLGNVIGYIDFGDTTPDDDLFAKIIYHYLPDKHIVGTPQSITVRDRQGAIMRKRSTKIDHDTGDIFEITQFSDATSKSVYNMDYEDYGNLKQITFPPNHRGQRMFYHYDYDEAVNTYITRVTDAYGYHSTATYDLRFGKPLVTTDLNHNSTNYTLDSIGRLETVTGPLELANDLPYTIKFQYFPQASVPWALTQHYDPQHPGNPLETVTFIDGLKRVIQVKKDGSLFMGAGKPDQDVMLVSGRVTFDAFSREIAKYYPVYEATGNQGVFNDSYDEITPTTTSYDVLNRTLLQTLPDNTHTRSEYDFDRDGQGQLQFSTLVTDANQIQTESYTNVRGLRTSVRQQYRQGPSDIWTNYRYNAINALTTVTDDQGNETVSTYDWLGRRSSVLHPDSGLTTFIFDPASHLIEKITANLQAGGVGIRYVYDYSRLSAIHYPQYPKNNVSYTYGENNAPDNGAGRVIRQEDASGSQVFSYNELGALVKNVRTIELLPTRRSFTYTTEWTYDTWNRVTEMVYPDGEVLTYSYNTGGLPQTMTGEKEGYSYRYVTQLGFDKFEQRVYLSYGNGTEMTYEYEPERQRLEHLTTKTAKNRKIMDNSYAYDNTINILNLTNNAPIPSRTLMGGSASYTYVYDDLYRLTHAEGSFNGSPSTQQMHRYQMDMTYNSIHSITNKNQIHEKKTYYPNDRWVKQKRTTYDFDYTYNPASQPHAPLTIGNRTYTYDANGNQTGWIYDDGVIDNLRRILVWDEENRIRSITDNGVVHNYVYDAGGERVLKSRGDRTQTAAAEGGIGNYTIYVNPYYVVSYANTSKHFFIGSHRMVTKLVSKNTYSQDGQRNRNKQRENAQYYYHPDHLGSSNYITNTAGEVFQHLEYFAFGETFIEEKSYYNYTPYLFNGKEFDDDTRLYYYGARYYDPMTSVWQSVDPLAEKYPNISPYAYTANNPVNYVDPDGQWFDCGICAFLGSFFSDSPTIFGTNFPIRDFKDGQFFAGIFDPETDRIELKPTIDQKALGLEGDALNQENFELELKYGNKIKNSKEKKIIGKRGGAHAELAEEMGASIHNPFKSQPISGKEVEESKRARAFSLRHLEDDKFEIEWKSAGVNRMNFHSGVGSTDETRKVPEKYRDDVIRGVESKFNIKTESPKKLN